MEYALAISRQRVATALQWRPEWPLALAVAAAWIAAVVLSATGSADHDGAGAATALGGWALMAVAMMGPMALPAVRHVAFNSLRPRRLRAMALYFTVFTAVWVAFGIVALGGERLASDALGVDGRILLAAALAVAAAWQLTPAKRRAIYACTRTVALPPLGRKADAGVTRFALKQGRRSVISCWALMLVMAAAGHMNLAWMAGLTAFVLFEELTLVGRQTLWPAATGLGFAAAVVLI
ncbi:MAG: DUF2182 domain-containing protein [Solirubrobacteraceae bacterium]